MKKQAAPKKEGPVRIILADDHPLFRKGLFDVLAEDGRFEIVGEAGDGIRALELIEQKNPRVAILDIDMPNMSGLDVAAEVTKRKLQTEVVVLTMHEDAGHLGIAMDAGAIGYVLKDTVAAEIVHCLEAVLSGKNYISPTLSQHLLKKDARAVAGMAQKLGLSSLTAAERKILRLVSQSKSSKEIAAALFISEKTVSAHRANICSKLGLHGTNALLKFALENKEKL